MNKVTAIDGDTIIYLACHNKEGESKSWDEVLYIIDNYINDILKKTETTEYCGYLSNGSFRYKIGKIKQYKANRTGLIKPKYFNLAKSYLQDVYNFKIVDNLEADDLCIIIKKFLVGYEVTIASPDKDLRQVTGKFYDYKKQEFFEITEEEASKNLWRQVLTGDASDNIPGLPGIGPVKADKILETSKDYRTTVFNTYIETYGEYDGLINFTENYQLVKMLDKYDGFTPEINKFETKGLEFNF